MNGRWGRWLGFGSLFAAGLAACQWPPDSTAGLSSLLRVEGGQAWRGSIAAPSSSSSAAATFFPRNATIYAGVQNKSVKGIVGPHANAVALGVAGDDAYWRVPALAADETDPDSFKFTAGLSITPRVWDSPLLVANEDGTHTLPLSVRAVDNDGNFGPASIQPLILDSPAIAGTLVVSLEWDTPTDLDLHVLVPADSEAGFTEVWAKARSASQAVPDGNLDFDSNANCQIDGREGENVFWNGTPPVGHYVVRVAAASLCDMGSAAWYAFARVPGASKGEASGVLTPAAARSGAAAGSGVTAFEFDYP